MQTFQEFMANKAIREDVDPGKIEDTFLGLTHMEVEEHKYNNRANRNDEPSDEVLKALKALNWRDVHFKQGDVEEEDTYFTVLLPQALCDLIDAKQTTQGEYGDWYGMKDRNPRYDIYFKIEWLGDYNRSHFPDGIPEKLRGLGLGPKLYRAMLREVKYITSTATADEGARRSWLSMVKNKLGDDNVPTTEHVWSVFLDHRIIAIDPAVGPEEGVKILRKLITALRLDASPKGEWDVDPTFMYHIRKLAPDLAHSHFGEEATNQATEDKSTVLGMLANARRPRQLEKLPFERVDYDALGDTYLGKMHQKMEEYKAKPKVDLPNAFDVEPNETYFAKQALFTALKNMPWDGISFTNLEDDDNGDDMYFPVLPSSVREAFERFYKAAGSAVFGKWANTYGAGKHEGLYFLVEPPATQQRTHLPDGGLHVKLRGLGLGPKMYRALLREKGYLRSDDQAEDGARQAWVSMTRNKIDVSGNPHDDHVYSVVIGDNILAMDPKLPDEKKIAVFKKFSDLKSGLNTPTGANYDMDPLLKALVREKCPEYLMRFDAEYKAEHDRKRAEKKRQLALATMDEEHIAERVDFDRLEDTYLNNNEPRKFSPAIGDQAHENEGIENLRQIIKKRFKALAWTEINVVPESQGLRETAGEELVEGYSVILPKDLRVKLTNYIKLVPKNEFGNWTYTNAKQPTNGVYMELEKNRYSGVNRVHFLLGVPVGVRGMGLGPKMYRAFLREVGSFRSEEGASPLAQNVWRSLAANKISETGEPLGGHIYSIMIDRDIFAIDPEWGEDHAVDMAKKFIDSRPTHRPTGRSVDIDPILRKILQRVAPTYLAIFDENDAIRAGKVSESYDGFISM